MPGHNTPCRPEEVPEVQGLSLVCDPTTDGKGSTISTFSDEMLTEHTNANAGSDANRKVSNNTPLSGSRSGVGRRSGGSSSSVSRLKRHHTSDATTSDGAGSVYHPSTILNSKNEDDSLGIINGGGQSSSREGRHNSSSSSAKGVDPHMEIPIIRRDSDFEKFLAEISNLNERQRLVSRQFYEDSVRVLSNSISDKRGRKKRTSDGHYTTMDTTIHTRKKQKTEQSISSSSSSSSSSTVPSSSSSSSSILTPSSMVLQSESQQQQTSMRKTAPPSSSFDPLVAMSAHTNNILKASTSTYQYSKSYMHPPLFKDQPIELKLPSITSPPGVIIHYEMTVEDLDFIEKHKHELLTTTPQGGGDHHHHNAAQPPCNNNDDDDDEQPLIVGASSAPKPATSSSSSTSSRSFKLEDEPLYDRFSLLIDILEKITGTSSEPLCWEAAVAAAHSHPHIGSYFSTWGVRLIHSHWVQRRTITEKPLLRFLWKSVPPPPNVPPALAVFRPRVANEKMCLRRSRKSSSVTVSHKLEALDRDLKTVEKLMRQVLKREQLKLLIREIKSCMFDQQRHEMVDPDFVFPHWSFLFSSKYRKFFESDDMRSSTKKWLDELFPPPQKILWNVAAKSEYHMTPTIEEGGHSSSNEAVARTGMESAVPLPSSLPLHPPLFSLHVQTGRDIIPGNSRPPGVMGPFPTPTTLVNKHVDIVLPAAPQTFFYRTRTGRCGRIWLDFKIPDLDASSRLFCPVDTTVSKTNQVSTNITTTEDGGDDENIINNMANHHHQPHGPTIRQYENNHLPTYEPLINDLNYFNNDSSLESRIHVLRQLRFLFYLEMVNQTNISATNPPTNGGGLQSSGKHEKDHMPAASRPSGASSTQQINNNTARRTPSTTSSRRQQQTSSASQQLGGGSASSSFF